MKIAMAQTNPVIADISGNTKKIIENIISAKSKSADIIVFPELATIGYPPMDILSNNSLISANRKVIDSITSLSHDIAIVIGFVDKDDSLSPQLLNSAAFLYNGKIINIYHKILLPTYDVFDEQRYFSTAESVPVIDFKGNRIGITICEDIWNDLPQSSTSDYIEKRHYVNDPIDKIRSLNPSLLINISASPYVYGKNSVKHDRISAIAKQCHAGIIYVNQVGGNDSLVFDGGSFFTQSDGTISVIAKSFEEDLTIVDTDSKNSLIQTEEDFGSIESALTLGVKDYCRKCGFKGALLGLSGGIDSALTAVIAQRALGKENVIGITMPSPYSSKGSVDDSYRLAKTLGIKIETISITDIFTQYIKDLSPLFTGYNPDVTEENLQARIRGTLLMALSNKFGYLLLSTGNKSELAMGYCTLYGDMNGGLSVISDLFKTDVYNLCNYINRNEEIIPRSIIDKAPSAELRENQKDQDSLPPYPLLDEILELYIEKSLSFETIVTRGFDSNLVSSIVKTVDRNEYKRRQSAPGIKVSSKAFGTGRRIPLAMRPTFEK